MMLAAQIVFDQERPNTKFDDDTITTNMLGHNRGQPWPVAPEPRPKQMTHPLMLWCCPRQAVLQTDRIELMTHALHLCADLWTPNADGQRKYHVRYYVGTGRVTPHWKYQLKTRDQAQLNQVVLTTCDEMLATQYFYMLCEVVDVAQAVWSKVDYVMFQSRLKARWRTLRERPDDMQPTAIDHIHWLARQLPSAPASRGTALEFNFLFAWLRRDAMLHMLERKVRTSMCLTLDAPLVCRMAERDVLIVHQSNVPVRWLDFIDENEHGEFAAVLLAMRAKAIEAWGEHRPPGPNPVVPRIVSDLPLLQLTEPAPTPPPDDPPTLVCGRCGQMQGPANACWCCVDDDQDTALYDGTPLTTPPPQSPPPMRVFAPPPSPPALERQLTTSPTLSWVDTEDTPPFEPPPHWPASWDDMA